MHFPSVSDIIISKPKKIMNTYVAPMHYKNKKTALNFSVDSALCIPLSSDVVLVKNKKLIDFIADLNEHIIGSVKANCVEWFNNNMNLELIEEYYVNPLKYDKVHGFVVKLKHDEGVIEKGKKNITINVIGIRFLKQKFSIEWSISSIEEPDAQVKFDDDDNDSIFSSDLEDVPEPDPEEIIEIQRKYKTAIERFEMQLREEYENIRKRVEDIEETRKHLKDLRLNLAEIKTINDFEEISEALEKLQS